MKFTVSQSSLTQAIGVVMKGVASASTLPILSGVLVKAQDGILEFQTSNYTISIRHRSPISPRPSPMPRSPLSCPSAKC